MDVTCGSQGLREALFLCTTYMTVAMTPLSILACPMSHQFVGGCDNHGLRETLLLCSILYDGGYDTSVCLSMSNVSSVYQWM